VKDFNLFVNRQQFRTQHEIWGRNLFNMENDDWKRVRTITSPSFTSGKLRGMNPLMNRCIDKLNAYMHNLCKTGDGVLDTKEIVSGFTIDVIASTSFATETNANEPDRTKKNAFVEHGMKLLQIPARRLILLIMTPQFVKKYFTSLTVGFEPQHFNFFRDLGKSVVQQRKANNAQKRNDLVQLLVDAYVSESDLKNSDYNKLTADFEGDDETEHNGEESKTSSSHSKVVKTLDDNEIIAQCILFFIAGFETTATTITYCLFELARNPEVQERLCEELESALDGIEVNTDSYYEAVINRIPYLDCVIKETLRKYPPVIRLERRIGVEGYKLGGVPLEKEQLVQIPTFAVHHNPEYYPEPERFNPDRFLPENKHLLVPYTYLPFGQGPRNCVGMRFAYQEIKLLLAKMLPKFQFAPTPKTPQVLEFIRFGLLSTKPFPLKVTERVQ